MVTFRDGSSIIRLTCLAFALLLVHSTVDGSSPTVAGTPAPGASAAACTLTPNTDFMGNDLLSSTTNKPLPQPCPTPADCCTMCRAHDPTTEPKGHCKAWSWNLQAKTCWMKAKASANPRNCTDTSGVVGPPPALHMTMHSYRGITPKTDGVLSPGEYDDAFTFTSPFTDGQMQWVNEFYPVLTPAELSLQGWIKHDHEALYLAFNISDDFLYAIQGDRWAPKANPSANCPRPPGAVKRH
jgi:hypothetical protein